MNYEKLTNNIIKFVRDYYEENNIYGAVLGISGGKDSAVVAAILCKALGSERVVGLTMPCYSKEEDMRDAKKISEYYGFRLLNIDLSDIFDDFMDFRFPDIDKELYGKHAKHVMKTDVKEKDDGYEVIVDLPGFKKDEIDVQLENGYLNISAAKGLDKDETDKKGKYIRRERYAGSMSRSFYVGEDITENDIHAKFENGILKLDVPKKEAKAVETKKRVAIEG